MELVGEPYLKTQVHLAAEIVLRMFCVSFEDWGSLVRRYDELADEQRSCRSEPYPCSWCRQPMHVLRKCAGCKITL